MKIAERNRPYKPDNAVPDRITVRLKPELAQLLDEERRERGLKVTEVIEQALTEHFARRPRRSKLSLLDALQKHGVIGAVDLGPEASAEYKAQVRKAIDDKHGHR